MTALGLTFLAGRYHATAWDRHVNEGVCEWPPAPLRVLRALAAALFHRCADMDRERALGVLRKLTTPPSYRLPGDWREGHTRHYLSLNQLERTKTALAFDSFVALRAPGESSTPDVEVQWSVALNREERALLARLAAQVAYLGRAESWCQVRLLEEGEVRPANCAPGPGETRLLCPVLDLTEEQLLQETALLRVEGYGQPPGTRWVSYGLPEREQPAPRSVVADLPQVAEFALGGTVLPLFKDAVRVAELFRRAALAMHVRPSATLSGHDDEEVLKGDHAHAHYLPEDRVGAGQVTHLVVYAPSGFSPSEEAALREIRYLSWQHYEDTKRRYPERRWSPAEIARIPSVAKRRLGGSGSLDVVLTVLARREGYEGSALFKESSVWCSRTPFVLPRHVHGARERDLPRSQLQQEVARRLRSATLLESVESLPKEELDCQRFRRFRAGAVSTTGCGAYRLRFREPVRGPLLLGANSHFGLGQFIPGS